MSRTMMSISSIRGYKGCHPLQLRFLCHMTLNEKSRRYYYKCLDDITTDTSDLYDSYDLRGLTHYSLCRSLHEKSNPFPIYILFHKRFS